ncbi:hypothetical protein LI328DRAFT_66176 [Trichoderma asperelloides]|nr:hypothetical protein LI328DRAFT_66176 [Trichoderma asperelloides]
MTEREKEFYDSICLFLITSDLFTFFSFLFFSFLFLHAIDLESPLCVFFSCTVLLVLLFRLAHIASSSQYMLD